MEKVTNIYLMGAYIVGLLSSKSRITLPCFKHKKDECLYHQKNLELILLSYKLNAVLEPNEVTYL